MAEEDVMQGPRGFILSEIYQNLKDLEHNGGRFCQITRERVDANKEAIDRIFEQHENDRKDLRENTRWVMWLALAVIIFSFISGSTLLFNIAKMVFKF